MTRTGESTSDWLVHRRFAAVAARHGDRVAVSACDSELSYAELSTRADRLAHRLRAEGAGPDTVVAALVDKGSVDAVVTAIAVWTAGAAYLPIDPDAPTERIDRMLAATTPVVMVAAESVAGRRPGALTPSAGAAIESTGPPDVPVEPDHLAYVVHTSGSTGEPKPVAVSHRALVTATLAWQQTYQLAARPRTYLQAAGPAFDVYLADLVRTLLTGGRLVLCPTRVLLDPPSVCALIRRHRVDSIELTPSVLRLLVDWLQETGERLPTLGLIVAGGERWPADDYRRLRAVVRSDARIVNTYGVAEATVDSTWIDVSEDVLTGDTVPIGRPFPGVTTLVLDPDGAAVRPGETGELYLLGDGLARGYHRLPAATDERFRIGPSGARMYRTGDLVRQRCDGVFEHLGRVDDEVKVRGVRIRLGAVAAVLTEHPAVRAAAVIRREHAGDGVLVAHVVAERMPDENLAATLRTHAARLLPDAMVPAEVVCWPALPITAAGKLDHSALLARSAPAEDPAPDWTPTERAISTVWSELLGRPPVDRTADFFQAGGSSLSAARLTAAVRARLGADLPASVVFETPTVSGLALLVDAALPAARELDRVDAVTAGQQVLWLLHQLRPRDPSYHMPTVVRLFGPVRVDVLRAALELVVGRHEALRTCFVAGPDGPVCRPGHAEPVRLEIRELGADIVDATVEAVVSQPFDLAVGPLLRAVLLRHDADRHDLVLVVHHIVFDGWSERVLLRELGEAYSALLAGNTPELPAVTGELPAPAKPDQARRDAWRRGLFDLPAALELPGELPGPARGRAARHRGLVPVELAGRIQALAATQRCTPFTVLLAAAAVLLSRWAGQPDLILGVPFGDRLSVDAENEIGFGVNTLPLRVRVPIDARFVEILDRVREEVAGAGANRDVPFEELVRELGLAGAGERNPLFRVWFDWLGTPPDPPACTGLRAELADPPIPGALFDLAFYLTDLGERYQVDLVHDRDVLDAPHMAELLDQYLLLLARLCARPALPVVEHDLRTQRAFRVVPAEDTDLRTNPPELLAALAERARTHADVVATCGSVNATYADVFGAAGALSAELVAAGVRPGDVVPVLARRAPNLVPALLGVLGAGAAYTLLTPDDPPARLVGSLAVARARIGVRLADEPAPELASVCPQWITMDPAARSVWPALPGDPDRLAYLSFTSGTTGGARGVRGTTAPVSHFLAWYIHRYAIDATDRFALLAGLGHDPVLRDVLTPMLVGATLCVPPEDTLPAPARLRAWLAEEAVTVVHLTPAMIRLLSLPEGAPVLPAVRLVCCGGDLLRAADVRAVRTWAPHARIVNGYGATETPQLASVFDVATPTDPIPVGDGAPGSQLLVRTPAGLPAGIGERGEVVVRGPYLAAGYLAGDNGFHPDPLAGHRRFATGDLGHYTVEGTVVLTGRADDQVQVRGFRVELTEVDRWLRAHPEVADAAAAARPGPDGELRIIAYLVPVRPRLPGTDAIRAYLRGRLPAHMLPALVVPVSNIPLTRNGKIDRGALTEPAVASAPAPAAVPVTGLEHLIADVWRRVLAVDQVDTRQNFFDLGGSSLLIGRVQLALEAALAKPIPVTVLFEHPTVHGLAGHLAGVRTPVAPAAHLRARHLPDLRARRLAARGAARPEETRT